MKIRVAGSAETEFTKAIGAAPASVDWSDTYTALQQGAIDGYWVTHSSTIKSKLNEVAKYCYEVGIGGASWIVVANRTSLAKLPPDVQKIVQQTAGEAANRVWDRVDKDFQEFRAELLKGGMTFSKASPDDVRVMNDKQKALWDEWAKKAGPVGTELVAKIQEIVRSR
jgi:TRAP-type C4-dicarboxylate transport system substrate-binding protein